MGDPYHPDLGVDVGGTFTDFINAHGDSLKLLSQTSKPGAVIVDGATQLYGRTPLASSKIQVAHGTTAATNAILTDNMASTALLVTAGFRDVLALGRQSRPDIYALEPKPLFTGPPQEHIVEVEERMDAHGRVLLELNLDRAVREAKDLAAQGIESFAICLLHSHVNNQHEKALAAALEQAGLLVCASSNLVPEFREFERFSTTYTNAALMPLLRGYVDDLKAHSEDLQQATGSAEAPSFFLMQSDGGVIGLELAAKEPVRMVLSGPAGGVVGAWHEASDENRRQLMTFDMGGTSTDVALLDGGEPVVGQAEIAGRPLLVPVLDIHTVGAGGGSIARADLGGALLVGPASASSDPGPACYGKGGPVTVTDAHLFLGRIPPHHFLGGEFAVVPEAAATKITALSAELSLTPIACALGILEVAEATMERALRRISLERGHDPRRFSLVCFGGAGALHGASLATKLEMPEAIIPRDPGLLSAKGMLSAQLKREYSASLVGVNIADLAANCADHFAALANRAHSDMVESGVDLDLCEELMFCDLRYLGQSFSMTVPLTNSEAPEDLFHRAHKTQYGFDFRNDGRTVELIGIRLRILGPKSPGAVAIKELASKELEPLGVQDCFFDESCVQVPVFHRDGLGVGIKLEGPAIVVEYSSTTIVPPGFDLTVDPRGNLILRHNS